MQRRTAAVRDETELRVVAQLGSERWQQAPGVGLTGTASAQRWPALGFHLNNQLTQALTSRYRDSRLRVDFERFVSCAAQLTCIFRHCSQHLDGGEGVICLTRRQWMEVATFS
eukprot:XP_022262059.1 calpain-12-like [Canis lupus familiaris]